MKRSPRIRRTAYLPQSIHHKLNMYATAAGAAGVGMLAISPPAEAKIVYTPAHVVIHRGYPGTALLDLNHDGNADFEFKNWWNSVTSVGPQGTLSILPAQKGDGNAILGYGTAGKGSLIYFASALHAGARIGPKRSFFSPNFVDWMYVAGSSWGQWKDVRNRYLGFKFAIKGKTHYGWARLNVSFNPKNLKITATLTGYAYESIPGKAIIAGKTKGPDVITVPPATLGWLALGRK
jgi:hypothetical protein